MAMLERNAIAERSDIVAEMKRARCVIASQNDRALICFGGVACMDMALLEGAAAMSETFR